MARKLKAEEVLQWRERIQLSEAWRKPYEDVWKKNIGYLKGQFFDYDTGDDMIAVNLVHPMVKVIIPSIYSKNPDVIVLPRTKDSVEAAEVMQNCLRYLFKELGLKEEIKLSILDALLIGHGWNKSGFSTGYEDIADTDDNMTLIERFLMTIGLKPEKSDKEEDEEFQERYALDPNEKVSDEMPWSLRTSPFNIFVPAYSQRPETLPWITERIFMPMEDVRNHPTWKLPKDLRPSATLRDLLESRGADITNIGADTGDSDSTFKIFYEIYDLRTNNTYVISDNDEHCYDYKDNPYDFLDARHPYLMLKFNDVPDEFYPISDVQPWEPQMHELNKTRSQILNHRKRYNRRYIYNSSAFAQEDIDKLKMGEDGTMIPTTEENIPSIFMPVQDAPLPPDVYRQEQSIKNDIVEISGITGYQKGNTTNGAKTATEAAIVESSSRSRNEERLDVVTTFANNIAKNLAKMMQRFMTKEQIYPIVGEAAVSWIEVKDSAQLRGDFLYETVYGSSMTVNPDVDRQQFMEFYNMAANDPMFDPIKLRLEMVRKYRLPAAETFLNKEAAEMIAQKRIQDALAPKPEEDRDAGAEGASSSDSMEGAAPGPSVPSEASLKGAINQEVAVPTPGGIGGGALETV